LVGLELRRQFFGERVRRNLRLIPKPRSDCPMPERLRPVTQEYLELSARHRDHPGTGLGPAARRRERVEDRA
jgi:DNA (cytosine-5)-methyltransferase 1